VNGARRLWRGRAAIVATAIALVSCAGDDRRVPSVESATEPADLAFTIPAGTGERMDRGEPVEILPAVLDARVGDVISIVNEDDRGHVVGPFYVGRHESLTQRFTSPGTFSGRCSVHPSGEVELNVHA
jgi:plastocyanin